MLSVVGFLVENSELRMGLGIWVLIWGLSALERRVTKDANTSVFILLPSHPEGEL